MYIILKVTAKFVAIDLTKVSSLCFQGSILEPSPTPTPKTAENNPLIMQIKKELGQIPADTVIQYQEEMIVKPKVKIEPMEEETITETPEKTETKGTVIDSPIVKQEELDVKPEIKEADTQPDTVPQETVTPVTVKEEVSEDS